MADTAHLATDKKLEEMEKRLSAIYSRAEKEIGERWKEYLAESQAEIDEMQKSYELAKKGGDAKEIRKAGKKLARAKRERTLMDKRFKALTETTAAQLANVNKTALAYVNGQLPEVYSINYNAISPSVDGVGGYTFAIVDADTVKNLATTDKSLLPFKKLDEKKDIRWNVKKMNAEVLQGILQGEPMGKIAGRLSKVTEMNETAAIRNARTMVTGAENKGRQDSYARAEADGIILERTWLATNYSRTRHSHAVLDGETRPIDTPFSNGLMYPGDPNGRPEEVWNCRCTVVAVVKGFKKAQVQKAMAEKQVEEQKTTAFAQAKTTAEAEAYAKEHIFSGAYLGKTSYKGIDVDMANGINETLERITKKYGRKLSGIEVVNPKTAKGLKALGGSADAPFATNSLNGMVYINKDIVKNAKALKAYTDKGDEAFKLVMANKDKLSGKMRALAEIYEKAGKDLVDSSLEGMITHEYGHYLTVSINPKADVVSKIAEGMGDHLISGYSQHNVREYLAECFTEYERGDRSKLDPIVIGLFEGAIKG